MVMQQPTRTNQVVIDARGLVKRYGSNVAVNGVDLDVTSGEIFGILGPNGAGKTTTLEMLEGLREPDGGSATLGGYDVVREIEDVRRIIGVQLQTTSLFDYLSAAEIIELFAGLYGVDDSPERVDGLLAMVNLQEKAGDRVDQLSGGQQQRLSIALGLVNEPVVAFLDEPTTGLDPGARRDLWRTIEQMRDRGATVVLTTHYMEEAQILCDRVAIMDRGEIIALDTPQGLIRSLEATASIEASVVSGSLEQRDLDELPGVTGAELSDGQIDVRTTDVQQTLTALLHVASRSRIELTDLRSSQSTLEDVFLELTGRVFEPESDDQTEPDDAETSSRRRLFRR